MRKLSSIPYYAKSVYTILSSVKPITNLTQLFSPQRMSNPAIFSFNTPDGNVRSHIRTPMELWSFKETLIDNWYCKHGIDVQRNASVVDIGCATGDFGLFAANRNCSEYIGVDPVKNSLELAEKNFSLNERVKHYSLVCAAVVGHKREIFTSKDESKVSSLHLAASENSFSDSQVDTLLLVEIVKRTKNGFIDILKMDCEGMEFEIILESDPIVFQSIGSITMEVHLASSSDTRCRQLIEFLVQVGYQVAYVESPVHRTLGYLYAH